MAFYWKRFIGTNFGYLSIVVGFGKWTCQQPRTALNFKESLRQLNESFRLRYGIIKRLKPSMGFVPRERNAMQERQRRPIAEERTRRIHVSETDEYPGYGAASRSRYGSSYASSDSFPPPRPFVPLRQTYRKRRFGGYGPARMRTRNKIAILFLSSFLVVTLGFSLGTLFLNSQNSWVSGLGDMLMAPIKTITTNAVNAFEKPKSTPRDEWKAGTMPYLYQIDPEWADRAYANDTIAQSGCGPTSLCMVYVYFTGDTSKTPADFCAYAELNGYLEDGLTRWSLMNEGIGFWGLASREIPADAAQVTAELQAGHPIICTVGPGDFTDTGHFMVLTGVNNEGQLLIHDPNSPENSQKPWDMQKVLSQCRNLWAFSKATG